MIKHILSVLVSASFGALIACNDFSVDSDEGASTTNGKKSCGQIGGSCVAPHPEACARGTIDTSFECGVGASCCIEGDAAKPEDAGSPTCAALGGQCVAADAGACTGRVFHGTLACEGPGTECCLPMDASAGIYDYDSSVASDSSVATDSGSSEDSGYDAVP